MVQLGQPHFLLKHVMDQAKMLLEGNNHRLPVIMNGEATFSNYLALYSMLRSPPEVADSKCRVQPGQSTKGIFEATI
jgi:hypothetical protein